MPLLRLPLPRRACTLAFLALAPMLTFAAEPAAPATPDPVEGVWTGTVTAPQGTRAGLGLEFFRSKRGTLIFRLDFPDMHTHGVTFGIPVESDRPGHYTITPAFNLDLRLAGDRLEGSFGPGHLPVTLQRGGKFSTPPPPIAYPAAPAPLWRHDLGASTWAPPVARDGIIYVGTEAGTLHAVDAATGRGLWTWTGPNRLDGAALVTEDRIYLLDGHYDMVALDRAEGRLLWRTPLHDARIAGQPAPDNPTFNHRSATPLLADGVLYAGSSDGGLYAVAAADGAVRWRHEVRAPVYSGVALIDADTLAFGAMDGSVVLLDRRTRQEIRRLHTGGGVVTTPLRADGNLVVGSRDYEIHAFRLADGAEAWRFSYWFSWVESTPVLCDGLAYIGASDYRRVTALEPATGRVRWSTEVPGMNWGTPLVTATRVFTGTVNQNIPGTAINHAAALVALDRATGAVLWQLTLPIAPEGKYAGFAGSLALAGDKVIAAGFDGGLYAYPAE